MSSPTVQTPAPARNLGRSVIALLVGAAVTVVLSLASQLVLIRIGVYPFPGEPATSPQLAVATLLQGVFGILSAWVTARLAPYGPLGHALIGGAFGAVVALFGAITKWNLNLGPHWYPIALVVLALPTAWIGGKLRLLQLR